MADEKTGSPDTPGGQPPEKVEDRPDGSVVTPENYPAKDRADSTPEPKLTN